MDDASSAQFIPAQGEHPVRQLWVRISATVRDAMTAFQAFASH
jgi:hypothetical protein